MRYFLRRLGVGLFSLSWLPSCGGGASLTPAQVGALRSGLEMQLAVAEECSDSGPCKPSRVRALERTAYCDVGGVLSQVGSLPDAGVTCPK